MDRLDELAVFVAILDTGSLAGAARRLRHSPPAVTRALAALEQRTGGRLVERTTRRLAPTASGRHLAEQARALLAGYADATAELPAASELRGLLRVTAPLPFGRRHVVGVVGSFLDAHPGVRVDLVLADRNLDLVEEQLDGSPIPGWWPAAWERCGGCWSRAQAISRRMARRPAPAISAGMRRSMRQAVPARSRGGCARADASAPWRWRRASR
jgi:DNA-binding transcriptional LysR family regulator